MISQFEQEIYDEFVHVDTHKQQKYLSKKKINTLDPEKDIISYVNHYTEVDAYARQTGFLLRKEFPNLNVRDIFEEIKKGNVKTKKVLDYLNTYKLPEILNKESERFFHTLYQYLNKDEVS